VKPAQVERTDQKENTEEKRLDTEEFCQVVEAQSQNKTDRPTEFVQGATKRLGVEVLKTLCVIILVSFRSVINICRSAW
jgi:hypothetical protein